jgi:hypothetical protein
VPPLLFDQDLLERVEALPAILDRVVDRAEVGVEHGLLRPREALGTQPVVLLALELERDQDLLGERSCAIS